MSNSSEQALNVIEPLIADLNQSDAFIVFGLLWEKFSSSDMDRVMSPSEIRELAAFVKTLERVCSDPPEAATEGFGYGVAL